MKLYKRKWYDKFLEYFFRFAASGYIPASWFRDEIPEIGERASKSGKLHLEIVSHCWKYSNMLVYQLSSLINFPPTKLSVVMTVYYNSEDQDTVDLLKFIEGYQVPDVRWNWVELPKEQLFRRGIGRNISAIETKADWVWFTDCDLIFHENCLDSLSDELQGKQESLYFPEIVRMTPMLPDDHPILAGGANLQLVDIDPGEFKISTMKRAQGPYQIVHGDVARAVGYCDEISIYQTPADHWCKCYEDRAFRWILGTQGLPLNIDSVYIIKHIRKGRYKEDSQWSEVRSKIRRMQE